MVRTYAIIIGQGICGSMLSYFMEKEGCDIIVIDDKQTHSSSRVASGVINPVTGKRMVKTWLIDELLPFALDTYRKLEKEFATSLISQCNVLDLFAKREEESLFRERAEEEPEHLQIIDAGPYEPYFNFHYGIGETTPAYLVDMQRLLDTYRQVLADDGRLVEETFSMEDCKVGGGKVFYKGITADKLIFCDGVDSYDNPYFSRLPFSRNKGEVLIVSIPGLPRTNIYKQGIKIVPWKDNLFWIGSSFEWKFDNVRPTEQFRRRVEEHLRNWLKLPFVVVDHWAAERPTTVEYKPFAGLHPKYPMIGIFNGMGTKGCSLAPYFAEQFARHLATGSPLMPEVDINRFARILNR